MSDSLKHVSRSIAVIWRLINKFEKRAALAKATVHLSPSTRALTAWAVGVIFSLTQIVSPWIFTHISASVDSLQNQSVPGRNDPVNTGAISSTTLCAISASVWRANGVWQRPTADFSSTMSAMELDLRVQTHMNLLVILANVPTGQIGSRGAIH